MKQIAIVGAGPIGLEAALAAHERGYAVNIFERGAVADAMRQWGHVRMFSPFGMNTTERGCARLRSAGIELPDGETLLTGAEFRESYLVPLARSLPHGMLEENSAILAIGRSRVLKSDHIGEAARCSTPFRLLVRHDSAERAFLADALFDCSGTYAQPNRLGDAGIPAPGEQSCADKISYGIPDLAGAEHDRFRGRSVLVVGAGHSAATTICNLIGADSATRIYWLLRRERDSPAEEIPDDPLPERARLAAMANRFAREGRVTLYRGASVEAVAPNGDALQVTIALPTESLSLAVDEIIVSTGFRPDLSLARELQLQTCWATEGTYPLAASLLGEAGADCLKTPAFGAEMLMHPEPNFFTLGMKSYGRSPNFLLRTGHEQIETVLAWLEQQQSAVQMTAMA